MLRTPHRIDDIDDDDLEIEIDQPGRPNDVGEIRNKTKTQAEKLFTFGEEAERGIEDSRARFLHRQGAFGQHLEAMAASRDPLVREFLSRDAENQINDAHAAWIQSDSQTPREFIDRKKRIEFRAKVFNKLCEAGVCGLTLRDELRGRITPRILQAQFKKLGRFERQFTEILNQYDGEDLRAINVARVRAATRQMQIPGGFTHRAKERRELHDEIMRELKPREDDGWARFLGEEGGDVALKYAGWSLGPAGIPLFLARGISEGLGYKFSDVLKHSLQGVHRATKIGGSALIDALPQKLRDKIPLAVRDWMARIPPQSLEKLRKIDLPFGERLKLLVRGSIPFGSLLAKSRRLQPLLGSASPRSIQQQEEPLFAQTVDDICHEVVASYRAPATPNNRVPRNSNPRNRANP